METKMLKFDMEDENQKEAYLQLERVRYYQTRFITKLVNDFFRSHNITLDTPYFDTKKLVKAYINGIVEFMPSGPVQNNGNNETINLILANMVQQQAMFLQQMATMMSNGMMHEPVKSSIAKPEAVKTERNEKTEVAKIIKEPESLSTESNAKPQYQHNEEPPMQIDMFDEEEDNDEDILDISGLSTGFSNMAN